MPYNYSKLNGLIVEKCGTQAKFSSMMGLSEHTVSRKLNGKVGWKQQEISKACEVLNVSKEKIVDYFFAI
mgnify:FL=1